MTRECSCALATGKLFQNLESLQNRLGLFSRFGESLPTTSMIDFMEKSIQNENHMKDIEDFCNIDMMDEKRLLKNIGENIPQINTSDIRSKISKDMLMVLALTKVKLEECGKIHDRV